MKTFAASAAALISILIAAGPAAAGDVKFSYSKDDLASSARISSLFIRIEAEATRSCDLYQNSGLLGVAFQRACAEELIAEYVAKIDNPRLTALSEERRAGRFADNR